MAAARRRIEIATESHGKIRGQHPKEGEHGPSLPLRPSGKAHLTPRGLAREGPPPPERPKLPAARGGRAPGAFSPCSSQGDKCKGPCHPARIPTRPSAGARANRVAVGWAESPPPP